VAKKQRLIRKTSTVTTISIIALAIIAIIVLSYYFLAFFNRLSTNISYNSGLGKFGIKKFYPTIVGGREWFINTDNPKNDGIFNPQSQSIRQLDGSW
jgi:hypothetical protein